jgi:hypothetical protein
MSSNISDAVWGAARVDKLNVFIFIYLLMYLFLFYLFTDLYTQLFIYLLIINSTALSVAQTTMMSNDGMIAG